MTSINAQPFVKWAGGKRQLLDRIKARLPKHFNGYMEPFVGGGAVYFGLQPEKAIINDINESLINAYRQIQISPEEFVNVISEHDRKIADAGKEYYYKVRELYNDKLMRAEYDMELAVLFVFLNKHCFNGLYRVNGSGLFNVPYNNSVKESCSRENILAVSRSLQKVCIKSGDFQDACELAKKDDFIFLDSPYAPLNPTSFNSYTKEGFDIESHKRVAVVFRELTKRGCYCMLTNHNTELINELYADFNKTVVDVRRMINSDAKNRVGKEIIITNY
ncbi:MULTISPECIES: Dam family site-specific DNA-(adenine-N6)-methyltransferase [unclassified Clostridium]|uniref:DNA adenine methylase n=1 Tax=unclassified Clostridium TaxID=2614128 RepID=UPI0011064D11|nr:MULTISPECIES: Dam family site-specific DNA-(adenine-N6)-methyltransferase [unclassified Clostridium]